MNARIIALLAPLGFSAAAAAPPAFNSPALPHVTSWLGNSYPGAKKWVQQDIRAMAVTADGSVFTNVEWEEGGGNVGEYRDGELVRYARHTHGWGAGGGLAVAVNSNYSHSAGREWSRAGYTVDRYRYPQDPRLHIWSAGAWVRRMGGQRILFVNDMNCEHLQVYRFAPESDGEIAIPSGFFAKRRVTDRKDASWLAAQPGKGEWIWRDANGNGAFEAGEFTQSGSSRGDEAPSEKNNKSLLTSAATSSQADAPASQGWWVDAIGNVWLATETKGIRFFPSQGLDAKGNPVWSYAKMLSFAAPSEFKQVKRVRYLRESDALFLAGTTDEHKNQHWKPGGPVLARYDGWLRGGRKLGWRIVLPYASGSSGHSSCEPMGFDVAGDFVFVPYTGASKPDNVKHGRVEIFRASDGTSAGHLEPSEDVGEIGLQDIRECLAAHRRADGEFVLFLEDDYKSKVVMYRLKPSQLK